MALAIIDGAIRFPDGTVPVGGIIGGLVPVDPSKRWDKSTRTHVPTPFRFDIVGAFDGSITRDNGAPSNQTRTSEPETLAILRGIGMTVPTGTDGAPDLFAVRESMLSGLAGWRDLRTMLARAANAFEPVDLLLPARGAASVVRLTPDDEVRATLAAKVAAARAARGAK